MKLNSFFKIALTSTLIFSAFEKSAQSFSWAKRAGLWAYDLGFGVGTDNSGNVYVSGKYEMNGCSFGNVTVPCAGNHDIFLAKYSPNGSFQWVKTAGSKGGDYSHCLAVDGAGNSYVSGEFEQTTNFGNGVSLTTNGDNDVFIAKYNTNGSLLWARKLGGGGLSDKAYGICVSGNAVYLCGKFEGTANFQGNTFSSAGGKEIFIAKYTTDGVFQWVRKAGGSGSDEGYAVATDPSGNVYMTGSFSGNANFSGQTISAKGDKDIFIAKYNSSGSLVWVKKAGSSYADHGYGIKVDNAYRIFLTGAFSYKCTFGAYTLTGSGARDVFIARYDQNGNPVWVKKAGGGGDDIGRALAIDGSSNVYITGGFANTASFGSTTLSGSDKYEIFFASLDANGNFRWALKAGGPADDTPPDRDVEMGRGIAVDPWGGVVGTGSYRTQTTFGSSSLSPWSNTDIYIAKIVQGSATKFSRAPMISPSDSVSFCSGGYATLKAQADSGKTLVWFKDGKLFDASNSSELRVNSPGNYSLKVTDGIDTVESPATKVIITDKIEAHLVSDKNEFCRDSNSVLKASESEGFSYRWKRNGRFIKGANSPVYKPERDGNYQVQIVQGNCFDWSPVTKVNLKSCVNDSLASNKNSSPDMKEDSVLISIYPNPNSGLFTLELNMNREKNSAEEVKVEVVNAIGQVVYSQWVKLQDGQLRHHVELSSMVTPGMYVLRLSIGEETEKNRLMLIR